MSFTPASIAFIGVTSIFEYGFIAAIVILGAVFLLLVESLRLLQLHGYCALIEQKIDETAETSIKGWEIHLGELRKEGSRPLKLTLVSYIILFGVPYSVFNFIASFLPNFLILWLIIIYSSCDACFSV